MIWIGSLSRYYLLCILATTLFTLSTPSFSAEICGIRKGFIGAAVNLHKADRSSIDKAIELAAKAKIEVIRWDGQWAMVEKIKGQLAIPENWDHLVSKAAERGIKSMIILGYGNEFYDNGDKPRSTDAINGFARYAEFITHHFGAKVRMYEVWNEWNGRLGHTTPGTALDYAKLLRATYSKIKYQNPAACVIGGAYSGSAYEALIGGEANPKYLPMQFSELLKTDASKYMDAISIHPYTIFRTDEFSGFTGLKLMLPRLVNSIRLAPGFSTKPIFITELGWTTASLASIGVSENNQATYIRGAMQLAKALDVDGFIIFCLIDGNGRPLDPEGNFGIFRIDGSPKELFYRLVEDQSNR